METLSLKTAFLSFYRFFQKAFVSTIGRRLIKGSFWIMLSASISRLLSLFSFFVIARILTKPAFGELGILQTTISMFQIFALFGLSETVTKYIAEYREKDIYKTANILRLVKIINIAINLMIAILLLSISPYLARKILIAPQLSGLIRLSVIIIIISSYNNIQAGILTGFESFKAVSKINIATSLINILLTIVFVYFWKLNGFIWAMAATSFVNTILNYMALNSISILKNIKIKTKECFKEYGVLLAFTLPALLAGLLVTPTNWICSAIIVHQPNGYSEMAVYNAANQWRILIIFLSVFLGSVILPILANIYSQKNYREFVKLVNWILITTFILSVIFGTLIIILSKSIMKGYGSGYSEGYPVLILITLSSILVSVSSIIGYLLTSVGKKWFCLFSNFIWAFLIIFLTFYFKNKGAYGFALATLISYIIFTGIIGIYSHFFILAKIKYQLINAQN
jgi:O-antigen/teichoic acid export membrane protein